MARTNIASQQLMGAYPPLPLGATGADLMFTAIDDPVSRSTPLIDNKTVVLAFNTDVAARTITISSIADTQNRLGDITAYSVVAGHIASFGPFRSAGWASAGALLYIDISDPKLRLAVIQLP